MKKYFISFILLFLFIPNVNAKVQLINLYNMKFYDNTTPKTPISHYSNNTNITYDGLEMTSSKFVMSFDNDLSNFDQFGFELYNSLAEINSNPNYDAPIMPLVLLDGYPCSVTPIGIMDSSDVYYYNADEYVLCPIKQKTGTHYIDIFTYKLASVNSPFIGLHTYNLRVFTDDESLKDVIQQQEQTQKAITDGSNKINDSITSEGTEGAESKASSFFDTFEDNQHGLSGIITAPLNSINAMLSGTCTPLTATWENKEISLPCGYDFWSSISDIQDFLNVIIGGLLCYRIILKLYKLVDRFKNPDDDRVEVMHL